MRSDTGRTTKRVVYGLLLGATILAWLLLGPRQLGGPVSYVITEGISMQPLHEEGDLVAVRESDSYEIGDVVAYMSPSLGRVVLHRIVGIDGNSFVFKGDNNEYLDTDRPARADLLGREWFAISGGGKFVQKLREPERAAVLAGVIALFAFGVTGERGRKSKAVIARVPSRFGKVAFPRGASSTAMAACGGVAVVFLLFSLAAMVRPATRQVPHEMEYRSEGVFSYSAKTPEGSAYSSPILLTGQPVFLSLVDRVRFTFDYSFVTKAEHDIAGTLGMQALVSDDFGWSRSFEIAATKKFETDTPRISGTLDLGETQDLLKDLQRTTGIARTSYNLTIVPTVTASGTVAGQPATEIFAPQLTLDLDPFQLTLPPAAAPDPSALGSEPADRLTPVQEGSVEVIQTEPNTMKLLRFDFTVTSARNVGALGLLMSIALFMGAMAAQIRAEDYDNEVDLIGARFKELLLPIRSFKRDETLATIEVAEVDALVQLAEQNERMILHRNDGDGMHSYFVEGDRCLYQYRARNGKSLLSAESKLAPLEAAPPEPAKTKK